MVVSLACATAGLLAAEGLLRHALFLSGETGTEGLRNPALYADPHHEEQYWTLLAALEGPRRTRDLDPLTGWLSARVEPGTYRYRPLGGGQPRKRPVMLYGASFSACVDPACFEELLPNSRLGPEWEVLNYGVGGYGLDQALLLLRGSIDHYAARRPIGIVVAVADSDPARVALEFRHGRPKPRFELVDGVLRAPGPVVLDAAGYLEERGVGIRSYLWRGLLHGIGLLPRGWRDRLAGGPALRREQEAMIEAVVLAIRDEFESRELPYFFLVCYSPGALLSRPKETLIASRGQRQEALFLDVLERHGLPFVDTLDYFGAPGVDWRELYHLSGPKANHPNPGGNLVLTEAICDGIERFERP